MEKPSELRVDLRQMIIAIETAVSLVGMNDTNHGKRVGYIASQIGRQLGLGEDAIQFAFDLGLLHDCGVSTHAMHANLVNHFDWSESSTHCDIGYKLLKDFQPLARFAVPVLHHHTHWNRLKKSTISPNDALFANLIFLSDRIDILSASHYGRDILVARDAVVKTIEENGGTLFDPAIVAAFCAVEKSEAFWISLEDRHITRYTWDMGRYKRSAPITMPQLKQLSSILAYVVDQKSPFTAEHSRGVASLAKLIAETLSLPPELCDKVEIAALLHDLGKLNIPDSILEKPGPLSELERSIMNQHSYETYEILRHIDGLEDISQWAAFHHEGINGAGYPFHPEGRDLSLEARIIAVADVFQALLQDRPYRKGMPLEKVLGILEEQVSHGKLDRELVSLSRKHGERFYAVAKGALQ